MQGPHQTTLKAGPVTLLIAASMNALKSTKLSNLGGNWSVKRRVEEKMQSSTASKVTVILLRKLPVIGSVAASVVKQRKSCSPEENLIITL